MAAPWFAPILPRRHDRERTTGRERHHATGCTAAVKTALAGGAALTIPELRELTGNRWPACEISAVLAKLARRGELVTIQPKLGKKGKAYRWKLKSKP